MGSQSQKRWLWKQRKQLFYTRPVEDGDGIHAPRYELFTVDGLQWVGGEHSRYCWDMKQVRQEMRDADLQSCPEDCPCKEAPEGESA